jgi:hypothetical protein
MKNSLFLGGPSSIEWILSCAEGVMRELFFPTHPFSSFTPQNPCDFYQAFPGTLMSTGTEDYFDSGWYFDAGEFRLPVSGFTHLDNSNNEIKWSAYR